MACTPEELISAARCMSCLAPVQHLEIQTYLLCLIAGLGTGGDSGAAFIYTGNGSPVGAVAPSQAVALYIDKDTSVLWHWYDGTWEH